MTSNPSRGPPRVRGRWRQSGRLRFKWGSITEPRDSPNEPHDSPPGGFPSAVNRRCPNNPSIERWFPSPHTREKCEGFQKATSGWRRTLVVELDPLQRGGAAPGVDLIDHHVGGVRGRRRRRRARHRHQRRRGVAAAVPRGELAPCALAAPGGRGASETARGQLAIRGIYSQPQPDPMPLYP